MDREQILALAKVIAPQVTDWRRHLHLNPELSFEEVETADFVADRLRAFGYTPRTQVGGGHGVVVELQGGKPGPTIALRADMDALPIHEETGLPFASTRPGKMHACGHDAHTSILLGAAKALKEVQNDIAGKVVFLFQPAEELPPGGAKGMVEAGVLAGVDAVFGLHVYNLLPAGQMGFRSGPVNANSDNFKVTLHGKGGHAASPHTTVDPVVMLGAAISAIQQIASRVVNPVDQVVVTIGWVRAGDANNVIPEKAEFGGTIRTFSCAVQDLVHDRFKSVVEGIATTFGGHADVQINKGYPVLNNDEVMTEVARLAAADLIGGGNTPVPGLGLGGEDFAYYAAARPACFARLGTGTPGIAPVPAHNPRFVINEESFAVGVAWFMSLALNGAQWMK